MLSEINSAEAAGRTAGQIFFWVLLLGGAIKCWLISRRPTTNTKSALALMMVFLSLAIAGSAGAMTYTSEHTVGRAILSGLLGLASIGSLFAAITLAIWGLVEYSRHRDVYTQGRAQAIWALCLAGFICFLFLVGFIKGIQRSNGMSVGQSQPGQLLTFDDFNFQFRTPDHPWVSIDASKLNKASKLALMRRGPEVYFFIIPEKLGLTADYSTEQLAEIGKANLRAAATSCRVLNEKSFQVGGLSGLLVETEAQIGMYQLHYQNWYCFTNGYAYQLIAYSRAEDQQQAGKDYRDLLARFTLIDPHRVAIPPGGFTNNFHSPQNHYAVNLTNSAWHPFLSADKNFPAAEFAAAQGDSCFGVVPVNYQGLTINAEALTSALLATLNITYPNENLTGQKVLVKGKLHGQQFDFSRDINDATFYYRFQIWQDGEQGYLVAAWTKRRGADAEAILADALARVEFLSSTNTPAQSFHDRLGSYEERKAQGYIFNQAGLYYHKQGEQEKALPLFCAAARDNNEDKFYVGNALETWKQLDQPRDALAFLATLSTNQLALPEVKANQAYFQAQTDLTDLAITNYASLFATEYRNDLHLSTYVNLLVEQKQYDTALAVVQNYNQAGDSVTARMLEAEIYREKKNWSKAISLLQTLHKEAPFNTPAANALVETYLTAGRYSDALELSKDLVNSSSGTAYAQYLKGRSELGLKWYREAKISLTEAVKLAPANKTIRSYLDYVSGLLGEGDNTAIMDPITPVTLPASLTNTPVESVPSNYAASYGAYYIRRIVAADFQSGKEIKTTESILVKILDTSGVSAFSTVQIAFNPLGEDIFVNEVRVMNADGNTITIGNLANYYVLDDRSALSASEKKILNIPVSGLQPGCQLAVTFTRRQHGQTEGFPFYQHIFSSSIPARTSLFFLSGDGHGLKYQSSPDMAPQKLPEGLYWRMSDPLVARWEPMQPPPADFLPVLWISEDSARWQTITTNYLTSISDRLELDPALRRLTQQLTEKLADNHSKIATLTSYVQTNLTYKAIEFGRRARIPNLPADIIRNKYGDCKDHAILLQQMLNAVGIPAQLALVSHNGMVQVKQPSLDQFDHMIVYVPDQGHELFLDCTSKGADVIHAIPYGLGGQEALILDAHDPHFVTIPRYANDASAITDEQHIHLVNQTDISAEESLTITGVYAAYLRDYLLPISESSRRLTLQKLMKMDESDLSDFKIDSLTATTEPLRLHFTYIIKKGFRRSGDQLRGVIRAGFIHSYLAASPVDNRLTPFEVTIPLSISAKIFAEAPNGFKANLPPNADLKLNSQFADGQSRLQREGNQLRLDFQYRQITGKFKATDYDSYRQTMTQALSLLESEIVFDADK